MMIAIFPNPTKIQSLKIARELSSFLLNRGVSIVAEDEIAQEINASPLSNINIKSVEFAISLGGDGTILRLVHRHPEMDAAIFGINLGGLGFMADTLIHNIYNALQDLLDGKFTVQERLMMQGRNAAGDTCFAVNEIVVHRAQNPCLIDLAIYVDNIYLNTFSADGIIVSTPSGSTAYSLASGGPILTPELEAFVITPICPHTISNRPIVLMPKKTIKVIYISKHQPVEVTYDGIANFSMSTGEEFIIEPSFRKFRLVSMHDHDYFTTLRTKLGWSGTLKI